MDRKSIAIFFLALMMSVSGLVYADSLESEHGESVVLEESDVMVVNPVPRNQESVAAGKEIYVKKCLACHGETGAGDGPMAENLPEKPPDLSDIEMIGGHRDGELFMMISDGMGDNMPAYKDVLEDDQIWQVVNYLRALSSEYVQEDLLEEKTIELTQEAKAEPEREKEGKLKYVFIVLILIASIVIAGYVIKKEYKESKEDMDHRKK
ncbi:MAG: c-type cytochrome [Candidatus Hydrothermarchaeales archaeon]